MTLGRTYDGHVLDMFEIGIQDFKSIVDFKPAVSVLGTHKPIMIFQGEQFETSEKHKRLKNLLIDLFTQGDLREGNIVEMKRVMLFTCKGDSEPI